MKKIYYIIMMLLAGTWLSSCTESPIGQTPTDSVAPSPLTNVVVEELPGGAKIFYDFPPDETDMSYVKGEYLYQGLKKVVRSSVYDNFLIIEGLGSTDPIEVTLYLVDHSENVSPPVSKTFSPKTPPIESIYESMNMEPGWGGVVLKWDNPTGIEVGLTLFVVDTLGEFTEWETQFLSVKEGQYTFREFDSTEQRFGIRLIDRWGNTSPIKEWIIAPKLEQNLDRLKHAQYVLPWDNTSDNGGGQVFSRIFDGNTTNTGGYSWHTRSQMPITEMGYTAPVLFTVDLGVEAILNRFMWWQGRWEMSFLYANNNARTFEVWGTAETPVPDSKPVEYWHEEWKNDWVLLADCEIVKPSGLPFGTNSDDDIALANAGHEFFVLYNEPVRYVRFSVKTTWWGVYNCITLHEISFFGTETNN
jgi:hypothetical protein